MFELIRSNKRRSRRSSSPASSLVVVARRRRRRATSPASAGSASSIALVIAGAHRLRLVLEGRRDRPRRQPRPARPTREQYRRLHNLVEGLCIAGGLPKPRVYVVDDPAPNAFATGRNPKHAAIAVTTGLLEKMNRVELEGVLAHELSHIRNYDILVSTLAVTLVGAVALLTDIAIRMMWWNGGRERREGDHDDGGNPLAILGFVLLILAPIIAKAMQATISPAPRDAGRRQRVPAHPVSAGSDLGAGEAARRHHGDALGVDRHGTPVDRAAA